MNYFTENDAVREAVVKLLDGGFSNATKVNFAISYSQNRRLSIVTIEISPSSRVHALVFFYSRALKLFDVIRYANKRYTRVSQSGRDFELVDIINRYILKKLPKTNPMASRKIDEETDSDAELKADQIQHLKDRLRIQQETNRSLRNQIKALKTRKKIISVL